jgi:hypothetical protein
MNASNSRLAVPGLTVGSGDIYREGPMGPRV